MLRSRIPKEVFVARVPFLCLFMVLAFVPAAHAQALGMFSWQQEPYCNVVTLSVTQAGGVYRLDGFDDQCGAARRGTAVGVAVPNPDGTIGLGLTLVTNGAASGGAPLHIDAAIALDSLGGTWRDSAGRTGAWTFAPGGGTGGAPRPVPNPVAPPLFVAGLSAGGQRVTDVAIPTQAADAASKAYVDSLRPRVEKASNFGSSSPLSSSCLNYLSVTITTPAAGRVVVNGNVQMQIGHTTGVISQARATIRTTPTDCSLHLGDSPFFSVYGPLPSASYYPVQPIVSVFDLPAGTHTFYLNGLRALGGTMFINAAAVIATWYPQ